MRGCMGVCGGGGFSPHTYISIYMRSSTHTTYEYAWYFCGRHSGCTIEKCTFFSRWGERKKKRERETKTTLWLRAAARGRGERRVGAGWSACVYACAVQCSAVQCVRVRMRARSSVRCCPLKEGEWTVKRMREKTY